MQQHINIETGEETLEPIDANVLAQRQAQKLAEDNAKAEAANAKAALLERLGITETEAKLLLS